MLKPSYFLLIFFIFGLTACTGSENYTNQTPSKPTNTVDKETKTIKQVLTSFFEDYQSEINKSDRRVKTFLRHSEAYYKRYFEFLRNSDHPSFSHLHPDLISQLKETLLNCVSDQSDIKQARACSEPLFQSSTTASGLTIIAIDEEDDEAVAHTYLSNANEKTVFTLHRIKGKWMITERENKHAPNQQPALPIDEWGVYRHAQQANQTYQIFNKNGQLTLEHCVNSNCQLKGIIIGVNPSENGKALKLKDFPTGELVPKWLIKGNQLNVFDYSVQEDKWVEAVYLKLEAAG